MAWLLTHGCLAYSTDVAPELDAYMSDNRAPIRFDQKLVSSLGETPFRSRWNELSRSGESRVPASLSQSYYDFDYVYWTQFAAAFSEPVDLLAVLSKSEREEIIQLTNKVTNSGSATSPMFELELREISHLAAGWKETLAGVKDLWSVVAGSDDPGQDALIQTRNAWVGAAMTSWHLARAPVHGRNRRSRAYRVAAKRTGPTPGW